MWTRPTAAGGKEGTRLRAEIKERPSNVDWSMDLHLMLMRPGLIPDPKLGSPRKHLTNFLVTYLFGF